MRELNVVISGFDHYDGVDVNPSVEVPKILAEQGLGACEGPDDPLDQVDVTIHAVSIPVSFAKAWPTLLQTIEAARPNIVIATGLKHTARGMMLERCATNFVDTIRPDADNVIPRREPIDPNGPAAYWTRLPLRSILKDFTSDSVPATLSSDAGTFVCNSLFYNLLNWTATQDRVLGGFVSFPKVVPDHSHQLGLAQLGLTLDQQLIAGRDVVREAVRYYLQPSSGDILID
jgi:pyroglutamyl-peptidase